MPTFIILTTCLILGYFAAKGLDKIRPSLSKVNSRKLYGWTWAVAFAVITALSLMYLSKLLLKPTLGILLFVTINTAIIFPMMVYGKFKG